MKEQKLDELTMKELKGEELAQSAKRRLWWQQVRFLKTSASLNSIFSTLDFFDSHGAWKQAVDMALRSTSENRNLVKASGHNQKSVIAIIGHKRYMPESMESSCLEIRYGSQTLISLSEDEYA